MIVKPKTCHGSRPHAGHVWYGVLDGENGAYQCGGKILERPDVSKTMHTLNQQTEGKIPSDFLYWLRGLLVGFALGLSLAVIILER